MDDGHRAFGKRIKCGLDESSPCRRIKPIQACYIVILGSKELRLINIL
jgi:hypothetical protein